MGRKTGETAIIFRPLGKDMISLQVVYQKNASTLLKGVADKGLNVIAESMGLVNDIVKVKRRKKAKPTKKKPKPKPYC